MTTSKPCRAAYRIASVITVLLLALGAVPRLAWAHQSSVKYFDLQIEGRTIAVQARVAPGDLADALTLPDDNEPTTAVAVAQATAVIAAVTTWMTATVANAPCVAAQASVTAARDARFVQVQWQLQCSTSVTAFELGFDEFFALDMQHTALVRIESPGTTAMNIVVRGDAPRLSLSLGEARPERYASWIRIGMDHIYSGTDHMCFLLVLLLVVVVRGQRDANGGWAWSPETPLRALRNTATVVTAFTVAHSLTLIAASLQLISLPGRIVEAAIAASIVYTAIENIVWPVSRWRFALSFAFGLIHGLGFASVLAVLLPPSDVVTPLLLFNVGVELGQLSLVVLALPVLWLMVRVAGTLRYRRYIMPAISAVAGCRGLLWLVERLQN